ncbi:MAG: dTDP-4-dehydrorhamnose reductase [Omnitrophica WOR_2 bacterium GWA2_47_8]|nr:MAG: dTDP-4-dehydrorhamnose reductase [Omnitrophica WOR_2 bacterium GWA2_47_8]
MKIFLTGAAGMLASEVIANLKKQNHQVILRDIHQRLPDIDRLDVTDAKEVMAQIKKEKPDYVFHLAAETDVDKCEQQPDHAFKVNTLGTENMALACQRQKIRLLYISTAGVFYGDQKTPYTEFDAPRPKNIYGESKLQGEIIVRNLLSEYFIIRAGWMVGGWEIDKKFVYKIVKQLREGKKELRVVNDKVGSPTFTKDFARNLMTVIDTERFGLYHMTNKGTCSRYDVAVKIVEFMGLSGKIKVNPISSDEFPLPAPRADSEMIRNYKLDLLGLNHMPHWEDSLKEYILTNKDKQDPLREKMPV